MGYERLSLGEFELEVIPHEPREPPFDGFGFFPRTAVAEEEVVRVAHVPEAPVFGVARVLDGDALHPPSKILGFRIPAPLA